MLELYQGRLQVVDVLGRSAERRVVTVGSAAVELMHVIEVVDLMLRIFSWGLPGDAEGMVACTSEEFLDQHPVRRPLKSRCCMP